MGCSTASGGRDASAGMGSGADAALGGHGGSAARDAASDGATDSMTQTGGSGGGSDGDAASLDAGDDAASDAGPRKHLCYVEGCNGDIDATDSAIGCPAQPPTTGGACDIAQYGNCFYCDENQSFLSIARWYPIHTCIDQTWTLEMASTACD